MEDISFSIIIPVYNSEKYLKRCLDSIKNQTIEDFEVLLIDDGSTDKSKEICDSYSNEDSRFKTFHLPNGGVSKARNYGLKIATGKYITFMDSDDFIESDTLETYLETFKTDEDIDAIKSGYYHTNEEDGSSIIISTSNKLYTNKSVLFQELESSQYYSFVWNYCIKNKCIENLRFDESINWLEDHIFSYQTYFHCNKIAIISNPLYHYQIHGSQITTLSNIKNPDVILKAINLEYEWKKKLNDNQFKEIDLQIEKNYSYNICRLVNVLYTFPFKYQKRKKFSKIELKNKELIFKEERLFFNNIFPFFIRDMILRILFILKNS